LSLCTRPAPPDTYPLSLHDALPIWRRDAAGREEHHRQLAVAGHFGDQVVGRLQLLRRDIELVLRQALQPADRLADLPHVRGGVRDRKSTRLNSSHVKISYAVFCLKK